MENNDAKKSYDNAHLAIQDTLYVIGGKWKLVILCLLVSGGKMQFGELSRATGISPRILSKELREMQLNKLVSRTVLDTKPTAVEYAATTYAKSLKEVLTAMIKWGQNHREEIVKN